MTAKRPPADIRILVLGINGLTGWHILKAAQDSFKVLGTYRKHHRAFASVNCCRIDMRKRAEVRGLFESFRPHYLFHSWAMCDLDICESVPDLAWKINVDSSRKIFEEACRIAELRKLIYVSSDHVFDGKRGGYTEEDETAPIHVYGKTRVEAEEILRSMDMPSLIVRPGLLIGASPQGTKGPRDFLLSRLRAGKPVTYFRDEKRSPLKAEVFGREALKRGISDMTGILHLGGDRVYNRFELACELASDQGFEPRAVTAGMRAGDALSHIRPADLSLRSVRL